MEIKYEDRLKSFSDKNTQIYILYTFCVKLLAKSDQEMRRYGVQAT